MSVLVERVMDPEFQKQPNRGFSGISQIGTKRKSNEIDSEFLTPVKMTRKEVSVQDVRNRDVICTFDIDSNGLNNLEVSFSTFNHRFTRSFSVFIGKWTIVDICSKIRWKT